MDTAHDSSPPSRELDPDTTTTTAPTTIFVEPPPATTITTTTHNKVKFLCSYGGRIQPRPHDNHLTYVGGDTKILAVDRNIKFTSIMSKLSALTNTTDICFKYQLPGEDLDALISVTNDEDLHHMMVEYDRLCRASPRPARLRLIIFSLNNPKNNNSNNNNNTNGNTEAVSPMNNFVDALNSVPPPPPSAPGNPDFLFGLDKPYPAVSVTVPDFAAKDAEGGTENRRSVEENEVQRQIQELQKLQLGNNDQLLQRKIEAECTCYTQKNLPEKGIPVCSGPVPLPGPVSFLPVSGTEPGPVYLIQTPTGIYQAVRAVTGPVGPSPIYLIPAPAPTSLSHSHSGNNIGYGGSEVGAVAERGYTYGVGRQDAAAPGGEGWK